MPEVDPIHRFFASASDTHQSVFLGALPAGSLVGFRIAGAGAWTLHNDRGAVRVLEGLEDPIDCLLACSAADFDSLLQGRLDAREAFLAARIKVEGDIGLIQRLNKAFARARRGI